MEETLTLNNAKGSIAAPLIFLVSIILQFGSIFIKKLNKRKSWNTEQMRLRKEIKELLKEAGSLSNPSTFAQAAKLRRTAAAKEKELLKSQETHSESKPWYATHPQAMMLLEVVTYLVLVLWFRGDGVAVISQHLLHPFGKMLSWKSGDVGKDHIMVGIIPWLILCNRVSKSVCRKIYK
ncbi:hypothetical protein ACHQM5_015815 [Ranunculus cassubicifolius]